MKKIILSTVLVLVLLVMSGCSQAKSTTDNLPTTSQNIVTFESTENSLYTPSGELLINLTWMNDVGKINASVMLTKTVITSDEEITAYIIGEEEEVQEFFESVQKKLEYYREIKKNVEYANGGFKLYGEDWKLENLKTDVLSIEKEKESYYYIFKFIHN